MHADGLAGQDILADPDLARILAALPLARLVGGCVRDSLARRPVADIDLATPDRPDSVLARLRAADIRVIPTGLAHGTVTALMGGRPFEITTLRCDEETDGRHARVAWTDDFRQDASRRDFTINAMSIDQAGGLHDYFDGRADLLAGRVRFVGEAARRVAEDHLRILRFFRFYARYGAAAPDGEAVAAIAGTADSLRQLSAERVWSELKRILAVPQPGPVLALMDRLGVLAVALPQTALTVRLAGLLAADAPADPILRLAAMLTGDAACLADRLKLSGAERHRLVGLTQGPAPSPQDDDAALRRRLAEGPADLLVGRAWLAHPGDATLRRRLAETARPVFPLEGRHAVARGMTPGPQMGRALRAVRAWWQAGGCTASEAECAMQLQVFIDAGPDATPE